MALTFGVLGPLQVRDGDGGVIDGLRPAHRRLLAVLLLDPKRTVETDRLIDRFWAGEPPATAKAALQTHISGIRRVLPGGVIETTANGYRVVVTDATDVDADQVVEASRACVEQLERGRFSEAADTATAALARWRGPAWAEVEDDEFARAEITRLEEVRLGLLERRAEAQLGAGHEADALAELEGLVNEHPLRERLWEHLIVARQRLGRHAEAVRAFRQVEEHLASIGVEPSQGLRDLEHRVLIHDPVLVPHTAQDLEGTHGFPAHRTSFVGRGDDLTRVAELLEANRLVTLTGVGGCGKTRLAVEAAKLHRTDRGDVAFFVDLAPLSEPGLVEDAVAGALGLQGGTGAGTGTRGTRGAIERALSSRPSLVVFDNCEHLLDACAELVERLLTACPELRVLATSREPLAVDGEQVHRVPSLSVPDTPTEDAAASESGELFVDRARAARSDFTLGGDDWPAIVQICRRLDGIPLAIEFAAARTAHLSPQAIADRLDDRFRLLTGGRRRIRRQQTLEATLDWSYDLLDEQEQVVLRRLAVFPGSFGLDMAEDVCTDDPVPRAAVFDLLARLVDRSLVAVEAPASHPRYRLLETVRAYAEDKLVHAAEAERTREGHRDAVLGWLESASWGAEFFDPDRLDRLVQERSNFRAALEWSWDRDEYEEVARLAARVQVLWLPGIGYAEEGRRWAGRALDHVEKLSSELRTACWLAAASAEMTYLTPEREELERRAMDVGHPLDGMLVNAVGWRAMSASSRAVASGDPEAEALARDLTERAVTLGREFDGGWLGHALMYRGEVLVAFGDLEAGAASYTEALEYSRPTFHFHYVLVSELATCLLLLGDAAGGLELASDALAQIPAGRQRPWTDLVAGLAHTHLGHLPAAGAHLDRAMDITRAKPVFLELNESLLYAAAMAHAVGDPCTASTLLAAGVSSGDASGMVAPFRSPASWALHRHHDPLLRRDLGREESRRCHNAGWGMDIDDAVHLAGDLADRLSG